MKKLILWALTIFCFVSILGCASSGSVKYQRDPCPAGYFYHPVTNSCWHYADE